MLLSAQLLSALVARREQPALARPPIGHEFCDTSHGPAVLELVEHVDEVVSRGDAECATGLHERVSLGEPLRSVGRAREEKVAPSNGRFADRALHLPLSISKRPSVKQRWMKGRCCSA